MFAKLSALLLCVAFVCALPLNPLNVARDIAANVVSARAPLGGSQNSASDPNTNLKKRDLVNDETLDTSTPQETEHSHGAQDRAAKKRQTTGYTTAVDSTGMTTYWIGNGYQSDETQNYGVTSRPTSTAAA